MSKPINPIAYRLGYNIMWKLRNIPNKSKDSFKNQYSILNWLQNLYSKFNIYLLNYNSFESTTGKLYINVLLLSFNSTKNLRWKKFTFIIKKWLNKWFFRQPKNKKHRLWLKNDRNIEEQPVYLKLKSRRLVYFYFLKLFTIKQIFFLENIVKKKIIFNVKNILFFFFLQKDPFISLVSKVLTIRSGLIKKVRNRLTDQLIFLLALSFFLRNPRLLGIIYAKAIQKQKKHNKTIRFLNMLVSTIVQRTFERLFSGLLIQIKGKINAVDRKIKRRYIFGKGVPVQTKKLLLKYAFVEAYTYTGVLGLKVWIY